MRIRDPLGLAAAALLACLVYPVTESAAQSLTSGSLKGVVRDTAGAPLRGVPLALEGRSGNVISSFQSGFDGEFRLGLLLPGEYRLLAEQQGYQPVRLTHVVVSAGEMTSVTIVLQRRPPPIEAVHEIPLAGTRVGTASGRLVGVKELDMLDWRRDGSDAMRGLTEAVWPTDGRFGFGVAASGLPGAWSRLMVDGVVEAQARHLGLPSEPIAFSAHARDGLGQVRVIGVPMDAEWRGTLGSIFAAQTRTGGDGLVFAPYVKGSSATLGGRPIDNPHDSMATSFQAGAVLSGAIVPDTAHVLLRFDYRSLEIPTAYPWENDGSRYDGNDVSLRSAFPLIAQDSFATSLGRHVGPAVRTWKGATGMGKIDWLLSPTNRFGARVSFADWKERTPYLTEAPSLAAGATLTARDISAALGVTTSGQLVSNELRAGFSTSRRDYEDSGLPETVLVTDGVAIGGSSVLPGFFDVRTIDVSDAVSLNWNEHQVKVGASVSSNTYQYDYRYGGGGIFRFTGLDQFGAARGSFYEAISPEVARFSAFDIGLFLQDSWLAAPDLQLVVGLRYDLTPVPKNKIGANAEWLQATAVRNDSIPTRYSSIAPRLGFVWDVRGEWVVRGGLGLHYGGLDPRVFAEAMLYDGSVQVRRAVGTFTSWPQLPDEGLAPRVGPALTILNKTYRAPRALKAEFSLTRVIRGDLTLNLAGSYHHTDFLQRREDLNRVSAPVGNTQEGRPVYGTLRQDGGFVAARLGSNRRFSDFDLVSGLSPLGFSDHYEFTAALERQVAQGLSLVASYTFSKTTDNMVGARSLDPANQLSPFPDGIAGLDWDRGTSDFDVPHRLVASAEYRSTGRQRLSIGGRYRVRSGLPFTPGFRSGVDVNADGAGENDPVFLGTGIPGLGEALRANGCVAALGSGFAPRNSCREPVQQALDLHFSVGLPFGPLNRVLWLEIDAFNVVATETGVIDRAAVLIDPNGLVVTDGRGDVTLPLIANPRFGTLLARRGEPRMVRVGLRMDY